MSVEQQPHGLEAHPLDRLVDRGQRRLAQRRLGDVVEADDREVVGHAQPERRGRPSIVCDRRRCRWRRRSPSGGSSQLSSSRAASARRPASVAADADEAGVERRCPRRFERLAVAALAQPRRLEVGAAGEERRSGGGRARSGARSPRPRRCRLSESTVGRVEEPVVVDGDDGAPDGRRRRCSA